MDWKRSGTDRLFKRTLIEGKVASESGGVAAPARMRTTHGSTKEGS
ncbi:MAG: hypothetical protein ABSC76_16920 [Terracidiphilus sp.]|jgi:hypothetical protein